VTNLGGSAPPCFDELYGMLRMLYSMLSNFIFLHLHLVLFAKSPLFPFSWLPSVTFSRQQFFLPRRQQSFHGCSSGTNNSRINTQNKQLHERLNLPLTLPLFISYLAFPEFSLSRSLFLTPLCLLVFCFWCVDCVTQGQIAAPLAPTPFTLSMDTSRADTNYARTHTYTHIDIHRYTHTHTHTHRQTHTHTYTCTHTDTHTHTHTYTCTRTQ
jgi:hypothetical protein